MVLVQVLDFKRGLAEKQSLLLQLRCPALFPLHPRSIPICTATSEAHGPGLHAALCTRRLCGSRSGRDRVH